MSLMEFLVAVNLSLILLLALLSFYSMALKFFFNQSVRADILDDSRFPLNLIAKDIREAIQIESNFGSFSTSENSLVLKLHAVSESGEIIEGAFDYVIYRINPNFHNKLERIVKAHESSFRKERTKILGDDINSFRLTFLNSGGTIASTCPEAFVVGVEISSLKNGLGRSGEPFRESVITQVKLRNKEQM